MEHLASAADTPAAGLWRFGFDESAVRAWLTSPNETGRSEDTLAIQLGVGDGFGLWHPHLVSTVEGLIVALVETGLFAAADLAVALWPTADGDGAQDGCLLSVDLPNGLRIAALHLELRDLLWDRDAQGIDAAIGALRVVRDTGNRLIETYERTEHPGMAGLAELENWRLVPAHVDAGSALARAVYLLYREIRTDIEDDEGGWNGGDVVALLCQWFSHVGLDIDGELTPSPS